MHLPCSALLMVLAAATNLPAVDDVRVMTFNILRPVWAQPGDPSFAERLPGLVATIHDSRAELVALQEENAGMRAELLAALNAGSASPAYVGVGAVPDKGATWIVRGWQVAEHGHVPINGGREIQWLRAHHPDGTALWLCNAHFTPFEEKDRIESAVILRRVIAERRAQAALPVIVCGDFNCDPASPPYARLVGSASASGSAPDAADSAPLLANAWRVAHGQASASAAASAVATARAEQRARTLAANAGEALPVASPAFQAEREATTAHAYRPIGRHGIAAIDHILVSPEWTIGEATIIRTTYGGILPSDHFAVFAWLRLR